MASHEAKQKFLKNYVGDLPFRVDALVGDASTRIYEKVFVQGSSFALCTREPFQAATDPQFSIYNFLNSIGIKTPRVLSYDEAAGFMLQQDLGSKHLEDHPVTPFYEQALEFIVRMQYRQAAPEKCFAFSYHFDVEKFVWEMEHAREFVFEKHAKINFSAEERRALTAEFTRVAEHLVTKPGVFTHRDYHSRNLMIDCKTESLAVIDFQDARLGPGVYDLVSLVFDSYVHLLPEFRDHLLTEYFEAQKKLFKNSREDFRRDLAFQKIQRCFKACGSFAGLFHRRKMDRYLQYLPHTLQTVRAAILELQQMDARETFPTLLTGLDRAIQIIGNEKFAKAETSAV